MKSKQVTKAKSRNARLIEPFKFGRDLPYGVQAWQNRNPAQKVFKWSALDLPQRPVAIGGSEDGQETLSGSIRHKDQRGGAAFLAFSP
jgi:hypothetical protein